MHEIFQITTPQNTKQNQKPHNSWLLRLMGRLAVVHVLLDGTYPFLVLPRFLAPLVNPKAPNYKFQYAFLT